MMIMTMSEPTICKEDAVVEDERFNEALGKGPVKADTSFTAAALKQNALRARGLNFSILSYI